MALGLHASNVSADEGRRFPIDLRLEIGDGRVALEGEVGILPPSYTGKFLWERLPFPPLLLASLPDLAAWLRSADSSGDLSVDIDVAGVGGAPRVKMSGRAAVEALAIADPEEKEVALGWKKFEVVMREVLVPLPEEGGAARTTVAGFDLVRLVEPSILYTHPSPSLEAILGGGDSRADAARADTVAAAKTAPATVDPGHPLPAPAAGAGSEVVVGKAQGEAAQGSGSDGAAPLDVSIATLELIGGRVEVRDTTVEPRVTSTVRQLELSARDVHFPDPSASAIRLAAQLPTSSSLLVEGDLRPGSHGDFKLTLKTLDLPTFSPYSMGAGVSLEAGSATLTTKLEVRGARIKADNALLLSRFGVSLRDPSSFERSFGMPIDLALALLRDPSGNIRLSIPVQYDEKGATVSVGAVLASALRAALLGAVTAPLKMLGAVFGAGDRDGGGLSIAPLPSMAGSAEPTAEGVARLDGLARLLKERPAMGLELRGRVGAADLPLEAERHLAAEVRRGGDLPEVEGAGLLARRRLREALRKLDPAAATGRAPPDLSAEDGRLYELCIAATEAPAARLDALAAARAATARGLLVAGGADAARLREGGRADGGDPGVVIGLFFPQ